MHRTLFQANYCRCLLIAAFSLLFLRSQSASALVLESKLVGGIGVSVNQFPNVISVTSASNTCTATVVGPRVLIMAAHCISPKNPLVTFSLGGKSYQAMGVVSPMYSSTKPDIGLAILLGEALDVHPATIGAVTAKEQEIVFLGYGSTAANCKTGDGLLSLGMSTLTQTSDNELFLDNRAVRFCHQDAGSPAFGAGDPEPVLIGVGTFIDSQGESRFTRTDSPASQNFLRTTAQNFSEIICGINSDCD